MEAEAPVADGVQVILATALAETEAANTMLQKMGHAKDLTERGEAPIPL